MTDPEARAAYRFEAGQINMLYLWGLGTVPISVSSDPERPGRLAHTVRVSGSVTAASDWGGEAERKRVRPALCFSYESLLHHVGIKNFGLLLRNNLAAANVLGSERLERAIGVIYRPETERVSHYFRAHLPAQFDAVLHIDETSALEPLERWAHDEVDLPETYPSGM